MSKRIALVTGANKGIGFATARALANKDVLVLVAGRNSVAVEDAVKELKAEGCDVDALVLDVTNEKSIDQAVEQVEKKYGRLDILINNAGVMKDVFDKTPSAQSLQIWRDTFETNVFGLVAVTNAFLPLIRKAPAGRIVNVSSILGSMAANTDPTSAFYGFKIPAYNISKSAVNAWTVHLAYELRETGIKVNAAHPGFVKTDLHGVDAPMSWDEGAVTSVSLALLANDGPNGGFFHENEEQPW